MKLLPVLLAFFIPLCLAAKDKSTAFPTEQDLVTLAKTIHVETENIQFLERAVFNSGVKFQTESFDGYRGFVAVTETAMYLILHKRLKARREDSCVIPFKGIEGISFNDHQVQMKCRRQVVIVEFDASISGEKEMPQHLKFAKLLLAKGVASWQPRRHFHMRGYKNSLFGVPFTKPPVFAPMFPSARRREVAASNGSYYIQVNQWDPNRWARQY